MTPAELERRMRELVKTTSRELLWNRGLELIRDGLGDNAHNFLPGIDLFLERVKQLGRPVVPVPFQGTRRDGERAL